MELLSARNIEVEDQSAVYLVELGYEIPKGKISLVFEMFYIDQLIEILDKLAGSHDNDMKTVIGRSSIDSYELIPLSKVYYFEARGNNVFCATVNQEFRMKEKLYEFDAKLPKNDFIRVGKSYIVNINAVKEIIPWFGRRLVLRFIDSKTEVEVSKNYVKNIKEFLGM